MTKLTRILILFIVFASACSSEKPDPYLEKLRTQYTGNPPEEDKAKLPPLQYNTDQIIFERALDIFLNPNLTTKDRSQIAPIIVRSYLKNSRAKFVSWHDAKN
jgi:hypothetical protein